MNNKLRRALLIVFIPVLYALILRLLFGIDSWDKVFYVMTISFLFCLPLIVGMLTIALSPMESVKKFIYRFFAPWAPIFIFAIITLLFNIEGWACWIMILPIFLIIASIGGLIAGYYKLKEKKHQKTYISLLCFLPLVAGPIERSIGAIPGVYKAYTYIDIHAPAAVIWEEITRVEEIPGAEDKGWLTRSLGFPRPVKAELNYLGVGASREAIFTNGLVFHETVTEYEALKKMSFNINADPHEIPSTTLDEHVVIGGQFFDVLNGTYELEQLNDSTIRLHLYSHFELKTTFNFYASLWAKWIMKDIQNNILQIEKKRAESSKPKTNM